MRTLQRWTTAFAFLGALAAGAAAAPPQMHAQAPGYYRTEVGKFEITALFDGFFIGDTSGLKGIEPAAIAPLFARAFAGDGKKSVLSVNAFLVHTGDHLVLVDTGAAQCFGPGLGQLPVNLRAAGYAPEDIDTILLTHAHGDHYCGLETADGKRAYPRATVWLAEEEAAYWLDEKLAAAQPKDRQDAFANARKVFALYEAGGALRTFKSGEAILPGVTAIGAHGHTPGHTTFLFQSQGQSFLAVGDILHVHEIQFARPEVVEPYDADPKAAVAVRKALFAQLATNRWEIGAAHLPFPGIGHIRKSGAAYEFVPLAYAPLQEN
ncbi:MAG TPA: MBL fold metallo-hydrolase [Rhizomicrobium sp.]|nr:MBL fold metallo-hydrolase [Rhizomicrobium sp.]